MIEYVIIQLLLVSFDEHLYRRILVIEVLVKCWQILFSLIAEAREIGVLIYATSLARLVAHFSS